MHAMRRGARPVHRWCAKEDAVPDLPLVIRDGQGVFTANPQCVAEHYAQEWKRGWGCEDTFAFHQELRSIRAQSETHFEDAGEWDNGLDLGAVNIRTVCLSFPSETAIGLDQHSFVLAGRNCQAELCQISHTNSVAFAVAGFVVQEKRR